MYTAVRITKNKFSRMPVNLAKLKDFGGFQNIFKIKPEEESKSFFLCRVFANQLLLCFLKWVLIFGWMAAIITASRMSIQRAAV